MTMLTATLKVDNEATVGVVVANPKSFSSGSDGFFGTAKVVIGGERFQVQLQAVRIGSKKDEEAAEEGTA